MAEQNERYDVRVNSRLTKKPQATPDVTMDTEGQFHTRLTDIREYTQVARSFGRHHIDPSVVVRATGYCPVCRKRVVLKQEWGAGEGGGFVAYWTHYAGKTARYDYDHGHGYHGHEALYVQARLILSRGQERALIDGELEKLTAITQYPDEAHAEALEMDASWADYHIELVVRGEDKEVAQAPRRSARRHAYLVYGSEDGNLGIYSTAEKAVDAATRYVEQGECDSRMQARKAMHRIALERGCQTEVYGNDRQEGTCARIEKHTVNGGF